MEIEIVEPTIGDKLGKSLLIHQPTLVDNEAGTFFVEGPIS
jgi:hypothetical protein